MKQEQKVEHAKDEELKENIKIQEDNSKQEKLEQETQSNEQKENKEKQNPLGTEKIGKLLIKFSIPCIISLVVNALYNIVDQIFIGQGVGYLGNAATNIVFPLTIITNAFALLIGDGAAANLSLCLGKKDKQSATKGVGNAIIMVVIISILFLLTCLIFQEGILKLFGVTEASYSYAKGYMFFIVLGLPFYMITATLNSIIRADGSPRYAMAGMITGALINIILDAIAILVLDWGVEGAAIATIISQFISCIIALSYLKKFKTIQLTKQSMKINWKILKNILLLGISSFITQISITFVMVISNQLLVKYGAMSKYGSDIPLSALGITMKVNHIINAILLGIVVGSQPILGFNYGAKQYDRVIQTLIRTVILGFIITGVGTLILQLFPEIIINLFGQENELYNEFAKKCFRIFLMLIILNSFQIISGIFMQAIGKSIKSAVISLSRQFILLIPAFFIWSALLGIEGILFAGPTADGLAFVLSVILMTLEIKKIKRMQLKEQVQLK